MSLFVVGALVAGAVEEAPRELPPGIPPGQEELLQKMLGKGADLPGACKLSDGHIDRTVIEATYDCSNGKVVVELAHSSWAVTSDVQTRYFAVGVTKGSPPEGLVDTLAMRILENEDEFEFVEPTLADGSPVDSAAE